ncbi:MAG: MFS transporter [Alphaproteobacteria bacterium]|nr:MFS transporter [Alphaproteobacteria bacterium]
MINTLAMILAALLTPLGGYLSDRFGYKPTQAGGMIAMSLLAYPLFLLLDTGGLVAVCAAMAIFAVGYTIYDGPIPITMAEQFPVEVRYSAIAVGFNISIAIFGGTAPFIATWLIKETGDLAAPAWYIAATGVLSLAALLGLKGRYATSDKP